MSTYDKPRPYDKPQTYDGDETEVPVVSPNNVEGVGIPWADAEDHFAAIESAWRQAAARSASVEAPWNRLQQLAAAIEISWRVPATHDNPVRLPWDHLATHGASIVSRWRQASAQNIDRGIPWGEFAQRLAADVGLPWSAPQRNDMDTVAAWGTLATHAASTSALWRSLAARNAYVAIPWGTGSHYQTGYTIPYTNPVDTDPLVFPDLPVYVMIPTITAVLIDGGADLKPLSVNISGDVDSWCWSFDMQIPAETFALVNPGTNSTPVEIRITVNGFPWSFIVESYADNRKWGARGYTIRGRSRSAMLAEPWAPARTLLEEDAFNAAQLADHELTATGWTLDWVSPDWAVPGGTWSYADLTPIAAMQKIAASIGSVLETDPDELTVRIAPRYPEKPWLWPGATPYAIVPAALLVSASGDWRGGANPQGIYVYAQNSSSGAFVRITGSDGTPSLPVLVEQLAVHADAQRERGTQELAKAGRSKRESIPMPLLPAPASPSLIPLRSLLEITDESGTWRGQVMGVQISASRSGGAVSVRQTLEIERQFRD